MTSEPDEPKKISNTGNRGKGRPKGAVNKTTADVRALAQEYGARAIASLASIMENEEQPAAARVSAAKELLDRGFGKSPQPITDGDGGSLSDAVAQLIESLPC
jgi:hypothetical protein